MDLSFPRPMLNSACGTAAGNAFYARVVRRVDAWRDDRRILNKVLAENAGETELLRGNDAADDSGIYFVED